MNKSISLVLILLGFTFILACSGKKEETASNDWPEMDEFHMVMASSFHPFKDSAYMEPAKANAAEMAKVAEKWANAPLPEKVNTDEMKASLAQLKSDTQAFVQTVQGSDTTKIGADLTSLHDLFHKLQEAWYAGGKEKEHEHH